MRPNEVLRVLDRDGSLLEENRPEPREAIRADTAYVMTNLLRGVMLRGTAAAAAAHDWPVAGKTGTMDDYTDAWFIEFDPDITVGVWVGYDEKKSLGAKETGAHAALPIWIDFMKTALGGKEPGTFQAPPELQPNPIAEKLDTPDAAPAAEEGH
jgi:penicillin-binding protein 1A